jgi:hypothetical protein
VSYANLCRSNTAVRTIMNWPGRMQANENKIPTILSYSRSTKQLSKWGFEAESPLERNNLDREPVDWFKVLLDETQYEQMRKHDSSHAMPESFDMIEKWFVDYLSALYKHIEYKLSPELPFGKTWSTALIEFVFSVPTTWQPQPTVEMFRSICARSGFAQYRTHSIQIGLTEAEAAAVHTSFEAPGLFKVGEVLLVCDIGGGTTDLSILKVKQSTPQTQLEQMDVVQGRTIGSAKIDEAFETLALQRLIFANSTVPFREDPQQIAWRMMKSREFQNAKCDFGSHDDSPIFAVPAPGLDANYNNDQCHIYNGAIHFGKSDMQELFDTQLSGLYDMIDRQLSRFTAAFPSQNISHLVLSGGLGNSTYVQDRLKVRYSILRSNQNMIQVHVAPEPQLAVCKGILVDRLAFLNSGIGVLPWRCARASYGLVYKMKYDAKNPHHKGVKTVRNHIEDYNAGEALRRFG